MGPTMPTRDAQLTKFARALRTDSTDAERILWTKLSRRQLGGQKFMRQCPIGPFIADFCCRERRLIVELDGNHHQEQIDAKRDAHLASLGYRTLRFPNEEIYRNLYGVLDDILATLALPPLPLPEGRGKERR